MRNWILLLCALVVPSFAQASPSFTDIDASLTGADVGSAVWGDYDNDGDLDILLTGYTGEEFISRIYRNDSGAFTDIQAGLTGVWYSSAAWGDYDDDGDLDILLTGAVGNSSNYITRIYRNDAGTFVDIDAGLPGVRYGSVAWGDYDNDGDLDIALTGGTNSEDISRIYRNDSGSFVDGEAGLPGVRYGSVAWGDYDGDGDLDLLLTGSMDFKAITRVYRNDSGAFTDIQSQFLQGVWYGSAAWGDYDNDGLLDILLTGYTNSGYIARVYRQYAPDLFTDIGTGLPAVVESSAVWGDYDNDGDLDILLTGSTGSDHITRVYRNDKGWFTDAEAGIAGVLLGSAAWGDYDNDGDLDILVAGSTGAGFLTRVYRSDGAPANAPPTPPTNLAASPDGNLVTFSWEPAVDAETPAAGLSYALRVGSTPGGSEICSAMAETSNGYRRVVQFGNARGNATWSLKVPPGTYYWSVQAIDGAFAGSAFATEESFRVSKVTDIGAELSAVKDGSANWGDYDGDGDLDLLETGDTGAAYVTKLYRNDGGIFHDSESPFPGVTHGSAAWGDYDNDGDLDIILTGDTGAEYITRIFRNDSGTFTDVDAGLTGVWYSSVDWGDYDNDGDLDILLTGNAGSNYVSLIYRNDSGNFTAIPAGLPGVAFGTASWGDYDNDGDLDILLNGSTGPGSLTRVYRNENGAFVDTASGLPGVSDGSVVWGDYDGDGDLDIVLIGNTSSTSISRLYRNDSGSFVDTNTALPTFQHDSSLDLGDYDNDGDLDLLLTGDTGVAYITRIYRNDGGAFHDSLIELTGVIHGCAKWGDYNHDGALDFFLSGSSVFSGLIARVYRNERLPVNTSPSAPTNLQVAIQGQNVTFSWDGSNDAETPAAGISYNVRIGATPGGNEISSAMADGATGYLRVVRPGNAQYTRSRTIHFPLGVYYWSVQAVDGVYAGSPFAIERKFELVQYADIGAGLPGLDSGSAEWGDYDNDGDLDVLLTGDTDSGRLSEIYRNEAGKFIGIGAGLPALRLSSASWGDYDNDGDLDVVLTGYDDSEAISRVYRNDSGVFTDIGAGLPGVAYGATAWGDYDNDGDLDVLLTGTTGSEFVAAVFRNDEGSFTDIGANLTGVYYGSAAWGDYDGDGDLDILLTGRRKADFVTAVYRNNSGSSFSLIQTTMPGVGYSSAVWGDYDNDGDLDVFLSGRTATGNLSEVFRNDSGTFYGIEAGLPGVDFSSAEWGDFDNDGDLDLLLSGDTGAGFITRIYRNEAGTFVDFGAGLTGAANGSAAWGDFDNDGDLDVLLAGNTAPELVTRVYRGGGWPANTPPDPPAQLTVEIHGHEATFSWAATTDAETPASGLSYNLRVGTTPGGNEVFSGMAEDANGFRRIVRMGNVQQATSWTLQIPAGEFFWSVQAMDGAYRGSAFAAERSFRVLEFTDVGAPLANLTYSTAAWGDYDGDGDLDLVLAGTIYTSQYSYIYRNDSGTFVDSGEHLAPIYQGSATWGDYDNDGDLDLVLSGYSADGSACHIYRNDDGHFSDIHAGLPGTWLGSTEWADLDNDGDLDLLVTGYDGLQKVAHMYRNDNGAFSAVDIGLLGVEHSAAACADYDNDGDLDILLSGYTERAGTISRVYRNDGGHFVDIGAGLIGEYDGSVAWGDYNKDGKLDILLLGYWNNGYTARIYRNDGGGAFTDSQARLPGLRFGSGAWGDYDNDGDSDLLLTGYDGSTFISRIYRNDGGTFSAIDAGLPGVRDGTGIWGDYDNDGDLDILLTGGTIYTPISRIYAAEGMPVNKPPTAPQNLAIARQGEKVVFSWDASTDEETPREDLSYNLRVGKTPGGNEVLAAMSNAGDGGRQIPQPGSAQPGTSWTLELPLGEYYWSVQAVDGAFKGSAFAAEKLILQDTGVNDPISPRVFALHENVPNPFNPATTIRYELATPSVVSLRIYDVRGRLVNTLEKGRREAGGHEVVWRGQDKQGKQVASGVYFYHLDAGSFHETRRMVKIE